LLAAAHQLFEGFEQKFCSRSLPAGIVFNFGGLAQAPPPPPPPAPERG